MRAALVAFVLVAALALAGCNEDPSTAKINGACAQDGGSVYMHRQNGNEHNGVYLERCRDGRIVAVTSQ
jgi:hypothetical protein